MSKALILTSTMGHQSLSDTVETALATQFCTQQLNLLTDNLWDIYTPIYRFAPSLFQIPYRLSQRQTIYKLSEKVLKSRLSDDLAQALNQHQPDLVLTTHSLYLPSLKQHSVPVINVLADPRSIHRIMLSNHARYNCVYDEQTAKAAQSLGAKQSQTRVLGWLVRQRFYQQYDREKLCRKLKLSPDIFTILICGGSEGTNMILKIFPALFTTTKPVQVIMVCGHNQLLYNSIKSFDKYLNKIPGVNDRLKNTKIKIYRFVKNMAELIEVSDLVVGKAGPNLLFETVAKTKPFLAVTHVAGQETGNLEIIQSKQLGYVEESPRSAIKLVRDLINQPDQLNQFKPHLQKERERNQQSQAKLLKLAQQII